MDQMMRDLQNIVEEGSTAEQRQWQASARQYTYYRVDGTSRSTDIPPPRAPHNFGICKPWYKRNRQNPLLKRVLTDWMCWPNPDGWNTEDSVDDEEDQGIGGQDRDGPVTR
jgi:hypothetical protein